MEVYRLWLEYELKADAYLDGLTGIPTDDPVLQEEQAQIADMSFRGSGTLPGPRMPLPVPKVTVQEQERCRRWLRRKIAKLKGE